ncbi:unnamed protein product [Caenorhabditis auriculariae]|uniref:RNA-directed DNA polymerase n=1 Tax=Caenorhabditis auriculariae TaxID=2777116 RepID=A0A8S1H6A4_9PELO|nr:unnamed protein product [Caenorhabditis auriculariae]
MAAFRMALEASRSRCGWLDAILREPFQVGCILEVPLRIKFSVHSQNRLVRWAIILLGYHFKIEYINIEKFGQADALSRMMQQGENLQDDDVVIAKVEVEVQEVLKNSLRRLPLTSADVRTETSKDKDLQKLTKFVNSGSFPQKVPEKLRSFSSKREELNVVDGCLMVGDRVVIPEKLRGEVLRELHSSHAGMDHMKRIARSIASWPGIDMDCENFVRSCRTCSLNSKTPRKVPLQPWPTPERVWQRIHIDYAGPDQGQWYLVVVDAKSKFPEVKICQSISATNTVKVLKEIFARNGFPETFVSDNGTQFTSQLFVEMCQSGNIQHIRTAPYCPQSNGQAERFVYTLKRALKKLQKGEEKISEEILNEFLMRYRRTPLEVLKGKNSFLVKRPKENEELVMAKCHTANSWTWEPGFILKKSGKVNYEVDLGDTYEVLPTTVLPPTIVPMPPCTAPAAPAATTTAAQSTTTTVPLNVSAQQPLAAVPMGPVNPPAAPRRSSRQPKPINRFDPTP